MTLLPVDQSMVMRRMFLVTLILLLLLLVRALPSIVPGWRVSHGGWVEVRVQRPYQCFECCHNTPAPLRNL